MSSDQHGIPSASATGAAGMDRPARPAAPAALRVLHVVNVLSLGGSQTLMLRLVRQLQDRQVQGDVCVLQSNRRTDSRHDLPVEPTYLDFHGDYRKPLDLFGCVRRLGEVIAQVQPHVVHSYLWTSDVVSAMAARRSGAPHLCHLVDRREWQKSPRLIHRSRRFLTRRAFHAAQTRFLAVSEATKDFACRWMGYSPEHVTVAYNAVDVNAFAPGKLRKTGERKPLVVGVASRIEPEKGHQYLVDAVAALARQGIPARVLITGEGTARPELERQVRSLGLDQHVEFLGWIDDVKTFFQNIDAFVVPSVDSEGLPTTILEAMASGCPVVASDVGGAREAIRDQVSGFLIPPRDAEGLAGALASLARDPQRAQAMSLSARGHVEAVFSIERLTDTVLSTYGSLARPRRSA